MSWNYEKMVAAIQEAKDMTSIRELCQRMALEKISADEFKRKSDTLFQLSNIYRGLAAKTERFQGTEKTDVFG